jgi:hypothetical protein
MYNLQFAEAHRTFREFQAARPDDPMGPTSQAAAYLFSELDRLRILQSEFFVHEKRLMDSRKPRPDPEVKRQFLNALAAGRSLAARAPENHDAMFAAVLCDGLEADYLALIEKRYAAAVRKMISGRELAERLLAANPEYHDAWLALGVENYMLSIRPAPLRWVLRLAGARTDRAAGIEKLKLTAEKGRYLAPFAKLLLAVAALRDNDRTRARSLLTDLATAFPKNALYRHELDRLNSTAQRGAPR